MDENTLTPLNNDNNVTGTTKTMLTNVEFDPFGAILYWESTSTINAGASISSTTPKYSAPFDLRYTFNCGTTLTAHKPFYLKVSMQSNGKVKIASTTPWAQALPTTADGYYYIYLGRTYSTYQLGLTPYHPVYFHDGTKIVELKNLPLASSTVNGYMSASDKAKLDGLDADDYAPASHTHDASDITSGTLSASRGGTGKTTLGDAGNAIINALGEGTSQANRNDYIVAQYANGGTTMTTYHRRKLSNIFAALNSSDVTTALGFTPSTNSHTHGNITNAGAITSDTAVASGDKIVVADSSDSSKLIRTGISFDGSTTSKALTPKGTWETFATPSGTPKYMDIGGVADYQRTVLALCELSENANSGTSSHTSGSIVTIRSNGLMPEYVANFVFQDRYGTAKSCHYSFFGNFENTSTELRTGEGFRACTFTYNNKFYGGLEFYQVQARRFYWTGEGTFTPFIVAYYNQNTSAVLNAEVNNSISHSTTTAVRLPLTVDDSKKVNGLTVQTAVPANAVFTDTKYTNGNGISLSGTTFSVAFPTSGTPAALGTASNGTSNNVARADHVHAKPTYSKSDVGLGNVTNDAQIAKAIGTAKGDIIYFSGSGSPERLAIGSNGQVLKVSSSGIPAWSSDTDTDTKVTNTLATTTKYYVTGTTTATTNTGTQSFDSGIYATTTAGQLNAGSYKVNEQVTLQWNTTDESLDFVFA